jgi:bacterioferritin-associated ferredoxin
VYVCLCMGITDREAREVIQRGAGTAREVLRACGSARPCGGCTPTLRGLLREAGAQDRRAGEGVIEMDRYRAAR